MKTPEQVLTEHTIDEILFDAGIRGVSRCVFTTAEFNKLANNIKALAYGAEKANGAVTSLLVHLGEIESECLSLRVSFSMLNWTAQQANAWFLEFCKPENLVYYESKDEIVKSLVWVRVRCVQASLHKCVVPEPTDWRFQSKVAAAREIKEFEELSE